MQTMRNRGSRFNGTEFAPFRRQDIHEESTMDAKAKLLGASVRCTAAATWS